MEGGGEVRKAFVMSPRTFDIGASGKVAKRMPMKVEWAQVRGRERC